MRGGIPPLKKKGDCLWILWVGDLGSTSVNHAHEIRDLEPGFGMESGIHFLVSEKECGF